MKPSKLPIILNSIALLAYVATAVAYFLAGKPIFGWIWAGCSVMWVFTVILSVKTYCVRRETAEMLNRRWS